MDFLVNFRTQVVEFFSKMEKKQIIRLAIIAALILATIITLAVILNRKEYEVLYSGLEASEQGEIYTRLRNEGVDVKTSGNSILLPTDQVEVWRMQLSSENYPKTGFNYDIYAQGSSFGSTDANEEAYKSFQLEEHIRTSLKSMEKISEAWVILSLQKERGFALSLNSQPSTASITVALVDSTMPLTSAEAQAIRNVVLTSSAGLTPENITIVDTQMRSYGITDGPDKALEVDPERYLLTEQVQDRISKSVQELLAPVFGSVPVQTALTLNFDRATTQSVIFEPPVEGETTGIPISLKELSESIRGGTGVLGEPGLDENGGAPSYIEETDLGDNIYSKTSREMNMEVNEIKTMIERAQGSIEDLSISVIIPLDEDMDDYTQEVRELVSTAIGTTLEYVTVKRLPIITPDTDALAAEAQAKAEAYRQAEMIRWIIIMSGIVIIIALLLLALRTVLRALRPPEPEAVPEEEGLDVMVGDDEGIFEEAAEDAPLTQIQRFIEKDPESVAQLLRNWLTDDYR